MVLFLLLRKSSRGIWNAISLHECIAKVFNPSETFQWMDYIVLKKEAAAFRAVHITRSSRPPLAKTENSFTLTAKIEPQIGALTLELQMKVREDFTSHLIIY